LIPTLGSSNPLFGAAFFRFMTMFTSTGQIKRMTFFMIPKSFVSPVLPMCFAVSSGSKNGVNEDFQKLFID